jgi:hypothetical protein
MRKGLARPFLTKLACRSGRALVLAISSHGDAAPRPEFPFLAVAVRQSAMGWLVQLVLVRGPKVLAPRVVRCGAVFWIEQSLIARSSHGNRFEFFRPAR